MADWVNPTPISVDQPITAEQGNMLQYNPVAITEGAVGAPRIQDAALGSTVTAAGSSWVQARMAGGTAGGVGGLAFAARTSSSVPLSFGDTVAGSVISASNGGGVATGSSFTGTWRCLGYIASAASAGERATLFMRIA